MTDPAITPDLVRKHNLTPEEYEKIKQVLGGREPGYTELGIFSVMWSEHCSYKNTRPLLKTFPTQSPKILVGAGEENAGIIDIGDGLAMNVDVDLGWFDRIVPCGITDKGVTSMEQLLGKAPTLEAVAEAIAVQFGEVLGRETRPVNRLLISSQTPVRG